MTTAIEREPLQVKVKEAARLLDYNPQTIRRLIRAGKLQTTGRAAGLRVTMASIKAYVEALTAESVL